MLYMHLGGPGDYQPFPYYIFTLELAYSSLGGPVSYLWYGFFCHCSLFEVESDKHTSKFSLAGSGTSATART